MRTVLTAAAEAGNAGNAVEVDMYCDLLASKLGMKVAIAVLWGKKLEGVTFRR